MERSFPREAYEALAEIAEGRGGGDRNKLAPLAAKVASDLKHRGRWPEQVLEEARAARREAPGRGRLVLVVMGLWLAFLLGAAILVGWIMVLPFAAVLMPLFVLEWHRRRSERARAERAERPTCPGCGYDLSGLADALPREWVVGSSGPRRCPECGEAWPLVGKG